MRPEELPHLPYFATRQNEGNSNNTKILLRSLRILCVLCGKKRFNRKGRKELRKESIFYAFGSPFLC